MLITQSRAETRAVIFDLGRVLVKVDFTRMLRRFKPAVAFSGDDFSLEKLTAHPFFRDFAEGRIDGREFWLRLKSHFKADLSYDDFRDIWCDIFEPMPGMRDLVERIRRDYPVTLLSDIDPIHWEWLSAAYPWLTSFPDPVLSYEIGHMKPHRRCYEQAARAVGQSPEHCLFIDDRPPNIAGACAAGMSGILFTGINPLEEALPLFLKD